MYWRIKLMKYILIITIFICIFSNTWANPILNLVTSYTITSNIEQCEGVVDSLESCGLSIENLEKLEHKLSTLDPESDEYKKWEGLLPFMRESSEMTCKDVANLNKYEMAVAIIDISNFISFPTAKLNKGQMGKIEFTPYQSSDNLTKISPVSVKMTVFGSLYCSTLIASKGNALTALNSIVHEILE